MQQRVVRAVSSAFALAVAVAALSACSGSDSPGPGATPSLPTGPKVVGYSLYTHCGVEFLFYEDGYYRARSAPRSKPPGSAPPGWGDPEQPGKLTFFDEDHALFTAPGLPPIEYDRTGRQPAPCATGVPTPGVGGRPHLEAYNLYTHCGVEFAVWDYKYFRTEDRLRGPTRYSAPRGWDDPEQHGTLTVFGKRHVRFNAPGLPTVDFYRTSQRPPPCD